jgi:hypothetical protein
MLPELTEVGAGDSLLFTARANRSAAAPFRGKK